MEKRTQKKNKKEGTKKKKKKNFSSFLQKPYSIERTTRTHNARTFFTRRGKWKPAGEFLPAERGLKPACPDARADNRT